MPDLPCGEITFGLFWGPIVGFDPLLLGLDEAFRACSGLLIYFSSVLNLGLAAEAVTPMDILGTYPGFRLMDWLPWGFSTILLFALCLRYNLL